MDYLARIDWGLAIVAGFVAGSLGLLLNRFLQASADEFLAGVPFVSGIVGRRVRSRLKDTHEWVCGTCRSLNPPAASRCYRGCGSRDEVAIVPVGEEPTRPTGGRSRRRC